MAADTGRTVSFAFLIWQVRALHRHQRCSSRKQAGENERSRDSNALRGQAELGDAVVAQRGERDATEVRQRRMLKHHVGQFAGRVTGNVVVGDAVRREDQRQWR